MKVKQVKKAITKPSKFAVKKKRNPDLASMDKFLEQDFESDVDSETYDVPKRRTERKNRKIKNTNGYNDIDLEEDKCSDKDIDSSDNDMDAQSHKKSLTKLKDTDPEFYSFLKENDKNLLDFNLSDDDDDNDDDNDDDSVDESEARHIPPDKLEVASDESDYEPEEGTHASGKQTKVTLKLLKTWQNDIQTDKTSQTIKCVVEAFHAALQVVSETADTSDTPFKVEGGAVFNGVVQICISHLPDAFKRFFNLGSNTNFEAHKCKKFIKIKGVLKLYLTDLTVILQNITSANILTVLLKHLHEMLPYLKSFSSLTKPLLKILLKLWSTGEETVRVVAFLNILRIATTHKNSILEVLLKSMYVRYVENAKFVSPNTLPGIHFMRHSLVEIYLLDHNLSYNHGFLYIRQLAIHLRNALTLKKKDNFQTVYNWQYINSLRFWAELMTLVKKQSMLHSLLYPLVQIIIGTIKMIPTAQYYPLRFHCVKMLIQISRETKTFIPVLPFLLEILNSYDFNKKHKAISMKPVSLICILRISKTQLLEKNYKDSIIETIYQLILENAAKDSHTVCFPDLYIPCIIQLKAFLKKCHITNYCLKMKQLLEKIEENRKFIETERAKVTLNLKNMTEIENWENKVKIQGTAIARFYDSWIKIHQSQQLKHLIKNDDVSDFNLPIIRKSKKGRTDDRNSDDNSDESEFEFHVKGSKEKSEKEKMKVKKPKKKRKISENNAINDDDEEDLPTENTDIVQDINSEDWV